MDRDGYADWVARAGDALAASRDLINSLNVFPVADRDTGTNLALTWEAVARAVGAAPADAPLAALAATAAEAAVRGALGNSGRVLAQLLGGIADVVAGCEPGEAADAVTLAAAIRQGEAKARHAVADPAEGTVLTVLEAAAAAAERAADPGAVRGAAPAAPSPAGAAERAADAAPMPAARPAGADAVADRPFADAASPGAPAPSARPAGESTPAAVAEAASRAADEAVLRTREQHPLLRAADVVDSGGLGIAVVLGALHRALAGLPEPEHLPTPALAPATPGDALATASDAPPAAEPPPAPHGSEPEGPAYEVTYLLDAAPADVDGLRSQLAGLGDSLVVAGGPELWSVHVHVDDVAAAIEAGIRAGRPHDLSVTRFADEEQIQSRAIVALVEGDGLAELMATYNVHVVDRDPSVETVVEAIQRTGATEVVVLAGDAALGAVLMEAAVLSRTARRNVAVVPSLSPVQSLVSLAVHDSRRRFPDDVISMAQAAAACRPGEVVATRTGADAVVDGRHHPHLDAVSAVLDVAARLSAPGGEILTVLLGKGAPAGLDEALAEAYPHLEVEVFDGGQDAPLVVLGVE